MSIEMIVTIGGVAGGATCSARCRRLDERAQAPGTTAPSSGKTGASS